MIGILGAVGFAGWIIGFVAGFWICAIFRSESRIGYSKEDRQSNDRLRRFFKKTYGWDGNLDIDREGNNVKSR